MAEKPSQRITTVSNKINVQQYICAFVFMQVVTIE